MRRFAADATVTFLLATAVVTLLLLRRKVAGSTIPAQCDPASHICEGVCPSLPPWANLPEDEDEVGLCLKDKDSEACVCWLRNPASTEQKHLQTLFKCDVLANNTVKHVMCLPPPICFPPDVRLGCMMVLRCPCVEHGRRTLFSTRWRPVVALILRSKTSTVPTLPQDGATPDNPQGDVREFSVKHLLFLLAFVIAPLLCWCLLTFFHEGKCRKKRRSPEAEPMPTGRTEEVTEIEPAPVGASPQAVRAPTAPKMESPPPYGEAFEPGESCPLAADCGPPPSYEEAVRGGQLWEAAVHRIQEV